MRLKLCAAYGSMDRVLVLMALVLACWTGGGLGQDLHIQGTDIVDAQGNVFNIKGINWFGFNNRQTMLDGLWAGKDSSNKDFMTIVYRLQLLGFNAVRLPFGFQDFNVPPESFTKKCTVVSKGGLLSLTRPSNIKPTNTPTLDPPPVTGGVCNKDLPDLTTRERFLYVVKKIAATGMYVMIDNHVRSDEDMTVHYNPVGWVQMWATLVRDLVADPTVKSRLIVDLINEPDNTGFTWENRTANGNETPGLEHLYLSVMDAIHSVSPTTLMLIEGTGGKHTTREGHPSQPYWGAFPTDSALLNNTIELSDANSFFKKLMNKPYLKNVLISYHAYSSAVIPVAVPKEFWSGEGLVKRYTQSFGYLNKKGYCVQNGTCHKFPIIIGEFSAPIPNNATDIQETNSIADYLHLSGIGDDGQHAKVDNWFFWAWNNNSGDTGGIATDDWRRIDFQKVQFLQQKYGLKPWYCNGTDTSCQSSKGGEASGAVGVMWLANKGLLGAIFVGFCLLVLLL